MRRGRESTIGTKAGYYLGTWRSSDYQEQAKCLTDQRGIERTVEMLRAITFDFWGTIVDAHYSRRAEKIACLRERLPGADELLVAEAYEQSWNDFESVGSLGYGLPPAAVLNGTPEALGVSLAPHDHTSVLRFWEEAIITDPPPLLSGLPQILDTLRRRGLRIALISDTATSPDSSIRQVLTFAGARRDF